MYRIIGVLKSGKNVTVMESPDKNEIVDNLKKLSIMIMDPTVARYVFGDDMHTTAVKDISSAYIEESED